MIATLLLPWFSLPPLPMWVFLFAFLRELSFSTIGSVPSYPYWSWILLLLSSLGAFAYTRKNKLRPALVATTFCLAQMTMTIGVLWVASKAPVYRPPVLASTIFLGLSAAPATHIHVINWLGLLRSRNTLNRKSVDYFRSQLLAAYVAYAALGVAVFLTLSLPILSLERRYENIPEFYQRTNALGGATILYALGIALSLWFLLQWQEKAARKSVPESSGDIR